MKIDAIIRSAEIGLNAILEIYAPETPPTKHQKKIIKFLKQLKTKEKK